MISGRKQSRSAAAMRAHAEPKKRYTGFQKLCFAFLFAVFALPQYFGIPLPGFALTAQRIMLVCLFVAIFVIRGRRDSFFISNTGPMGGHALIASPFIFVCLGTAIFRSDPKSFLNFFMDAFLPMLLMVYMATNVFTLKELLKFFKVILIVVCVMCYLDALVLHRNPYDFIHTIKSVEGGSTWRAGSYRTAAMASHPIGLGMYFLLTTPLLCVEDDGRSANIAKNWGSLLLVCGAVLLTGSRSPQLLFAFELVILFLLTEKSVKRVVFPYLLVFGTVLVLLIVLLHNEGHVRRYVILNLYQLIDAVFGTELVLDEFGYWQWALNVSSTEYRDVLPLLLFSTDYDPLLGAGITGAASLGTIVVGGGKVASIDNFYVLQYLRFAWPGLISTVLMFVYMAVQCFFGAHKRASAVCKGMVISLLLYFINLWFVADLGTFKYAFTLFGLAYVYSKGMGLSQKELSAKENEKVDESLAEADAPRRGAHFLQRGPVPRHG